MKESPLSVLSISITFNVNKQTKCWLLRPRIVDWWKRKPLRYHGTVPVKFKLTITRNLNDSTQSSILKTLILRVSSLELSRSSFESSWSSFTSSRSSFKSRRQRIYHSINFSKYMCMSILLIYFWRERCFPSHDSRGGKRLYICKSVGLLKSIVLSPGWTSFDSELIMVHFRETVLNTTLSFV